MREIEASAPEVALAEQSKRAKLLASLGPHLAPAEATRIVERLIDELEQADRSAGAPTAMSTQSTPSAVTLPPIRHGDSSSWRHAAATNWSG